MNQIEIRKAITLLELQDKFKGIDDIEYDERQMCFWVHHIGYESWPVLNPLKDKSLLFDLMVKYKVIFNPVHKVVVAHTNVIYEDEYGEIISFDGTRTENYETDEDIPEAILICILKSQS